MSEKKNDGSENKASEKKKAPDEKGEAANAEDQSKTFDMYHVKSRLDLVFLVGFVLIMILLFLFAVMFASGDSI